MAALVASPAPALACWDGFSATVGHARYAQAMAAGEWSVEGARDATRWAARFDALLPTGVELDVQNANFSCTGAKACDALSAPPDAGPAALFDAIADAFGVPRAARTAAFARTQPIYTVQLFAGSRRAALALRDRVNQRAATGTLDTGPDGELFEAGGFPALNPKAHAVADATDPKLVRVVVEEYPSIDAARAGARALRSQGFEGVVKELPRGTALDEPASSAEG
jgi:hypothetical protein